MKKEHLQDLSVAINYLESYPAVKGSEAGNWFQLTQALKAIAKDMEDELKVKGGLFGDPQGKTEGMEDLTPLPEEEEIIK